MAERSLPGTSPHGRRISLRGLLVFTAALLWLLIPISVFFIFHKPFPAEVWGRVRDALIDLLAAGWILWIGIGIGLRFVRRGERTALECFALSGALGLGVLSVIGLGAAAAGWMTRAGAAVFCAGATLLVSVPLAREIRVSAGRLPRPHSGKGGFSVFTALFAAASSALSLGIALAPPLAWDSLVYHFRIPQQILSGGALPLAGYSLFDEMPHVGEMLYAAAIALTGRAETAAVLGWGTAMLALAGITGCARRMGLRHALLPAALLLSGDTLARSMGWGYVDWLSALFGFAALCSLSRGEAGAKRAFAAGVFAGFAFGTKYTSGVILGVLLLAVVSLRDWRRSLKESALLLAGFALAFSPWILRGLSLWGDPLPPLLDSGPLAAWKMDFFTARPLENPLGMAAIMPFLQSTVGTYGAPPFAVTIGPLLLIFLPGVIARRGGERTAEKGLLKLCGLSAVLYWVVCGLGGFFSATLTQPRLYMPLFPGIALLSAYGFEGLWNIRLPKVRLGALALILAGLVFTVQVSGFLQSWVSSGIPDYLAGSLSRREYLEKNLGWYSRAMERLQSLPEGSRVLMLWEPRGFYCGPVCSEDSTIDRWYLAMRAGKSADEILAQWRSEGWTHILIFDAGAAFEREGRSEYDASDWKQLDRLRGLLPVVERFGEGYTLYSLGWTGAVLAFGRDKPP
jgi:hypothetical protein